jgi:GWxTD domain-containing protein
MTELWTDANARTLLHSLWEGAVTALALAVTLSFLRSPRARYTAGCAAIVVVVGGLLVTFVHLAPPLRFHTDLAGAGRTAAFGPDAALPEISTPEPKNGHLLTWIVPLWMAGVLLFYLRAAMGWMETRRLRRTGICLAAEAWQDRIVDLNAQLRCSRTVALMESCLAEVPVVIGYLRPVILMPVGLLAGLPAGQVEAILLHELAHIRRYDYLVNLLQVVAEGLLFYNPAIWWISRIIRDERENCCDDLVVEVIGGAFEYATALAALESRRSIAHPALAATGGNLVNRVRRLLGRGEPRYAAAMPVLTAGILALGAATAMVALQLGSDAQRNNAPGSEKTPARTATPSPQPYSQQTAQPDKVLFDGAVQDIEQGQFEAARSLLNTLIDTYQNSEYVMRAKLAIADSWRREGGAHGLAQAEAEYRDFIRFYPGTEQAKLAELTLTLMIPHYERWLLEDVAYIISDAERVAFLQLTTDDEREKFIEQFWLRRDPTPGTEANEFKEEHYRRIAFTNDHFSDSKIAGWRTDRGRIYIQYGPPDEIESHPDPGGPALPFENWRYRYIDGAGQNVIIEFVDPSRNGEYKMTTDPSAR